MIPEWGHDMANVEKCERVLAHVKADPELLRQDKWMIKNECGTAGCFAGWAALLNGHTPRWHHFGSDDWESAYACDEEGRCVLISEVAESLLELTKREADVLFYGKNKIEDIELMVKNLANGDPIDKGTYHEGNDFAGRHGV